jgi:hypothetical protein
MASMLPNRAGCDFGSEYRAERAGRIGINEALVTLSTEQAAAKVAAQIGKVEVKTATLERAAVLMMGCVGSGYIEWP